MWNLDLKQTYCRDLRDCQTYFPCAVFSSGFSYLYVIKRCPNGQIFDEKKQKCVRNNYEDPSCGKEPPPGRPRLTTRRPSLTGSPKRKFQTKRTLPMRTTTSNFLKSKNFDHEDEELEDFELTTPMVRKQTRPMQDLAGTMHRVCYVANWSRFRSGEAKFQIEYIDPYMCSHIIYAYATIDDTKPEIVPVQKEDIGRYWNMKSVRYLFKAEFFSHRL